MSGPRRHGLFEAPESPDTEPRLRVDPGWTPGRLSVALIVSCRNRLVPAALLVVVFNVAGMLLPVAIGGFVDAVITPLAAAAAPAELTGPAACWLGGVVAVYLIADLSYRFGGRLGWFAVQRSQYELSQAVLGRLLDERGLSEPRAPGEMVAVATGDVRRTCLVLYAAVYPLGDLVGLLVAAGLLVSIQPSLGVGVILALPLVLALMHLAARPLRRRSADEQAGLADAGAAAADLVAGYRVIRGLHAQRTAAERYRSTSRAALDAALRARAAGAAFDGISAGTAQGFAAVVVIVAAGLAFAGEVTAGQLVTVAGIAVTLIGPLDALVGTLGEIWATSQASAGRVLRQLAAEPNPAGAGVAEPGPGPLRFEGLVLRGGGVLTGEIADEFVAVDLPHDAHGELAAVLSLAELPRSGRVTWAGVPLHAHRPALVRSRLLVVPRAPGVFAGDVLANVRAGDGRPSVAAASEALAVAALSPAELPHGYHTVVGDAGWSLSGGQRQRIALARALAADPEVLVLIEPTASVDAVTAQRVAGALRAHRRGKATLVVSAAPAFRAVADRVLTATPEGRAND